MLRVPLVGTVVIKFAVVVVLVIAGVESEPVIVTKMEPRLVDSGSVFVDVWAFTVVTFPEVFAEVGVESGLEPCLLEV